MKWGLALSGGGSLGGYEYGAIQALIEAGYHFDVITGTSIGALNGMLLAAARMDRMKKVWESVTIDDVIVDGFDFALPITQTFSLKKNSKFQKFLRSYLKDHIGADVTPLKKMIADNLEGIDVAGLKVKIGVVACTYPGFSEEHFLLNEVESDRVKDCLLASCSCFPAFPVCKIGKKSYVDGGWKNEVPIDYCFELGADKVIAIELQCFPPPQKKEYFALPNVLMISPSRDQGSFLSFNREMIDKNIKLGYLDARVALGLNKGEKYCFRPNKALETLALKHVKEGLKDGAGFVNKAFKKLSTGAKRLKGKDEVAFFLLNLERVASLFGLDPYKEYGIEEMGRKIIAQASLYDSKKPNPEQAYWRSLFWEEEASFANPFLRRLDTMLFNTLWL